MNASLSRWLILLISFCSSSATWGQPFPDARRAPPTGWTGHVFKLSQDYPGTLPSKQVPWESFNFRTQPEQYMRAIMNYALEGNLGVDWDVDRNPVRKWYHTPWMHRGDSPREFVRGLTKERSSRSRELHPQQTGSVENWAVGFYNPRGGYTLGKVWLTGGVPDATKARFRSGAVAVKLLFTKATDAQVPFLHGTFEWQADTENNPNNLQTVRLLQVDIAVRDTRNSSRTGWVFGTFIYNGDAPGNTPWERLVPVGLMWGNDPTVTPSAVQSGQAQIVQSWINPSARSVMQHYGWAGRLNGPVDNPMSSCLSCHSAAQLPAARMLPPANSTESQRLKWFRNIKAGSPFDPGAQSLDYSLQLSVGIQNYLESLPRVSRDEGPSQ